MSKSLYSPKVLFVNDEPYDQMTSFIKQDLDGLRKSYKVEYLSLHKYKHHLLSIFSPSVWNAVYRNDLIFAWFGWNAPVAIIAGLLGKPSVIVAGGADVVSIPEIGYGLNRKKIIYTFIKTLGYRMATKVLLFSESSKKDWITLPGMKPEKAQTLYLGIDSDYFQPKGIKKPQVLTISYISETNLRRKGLLTFLDAARLAPEISFRIGGKIEHGSAVQKIKSASTSNVTFLGTLDKAQLLREYQSASIYTQLSIHEGFGVALAEAMACACFPIVTNRGAIPEVVGNSGIYVPNDDPTATRDAIRQIIKFRDNTAGQYARERIIDLFPVSKRKQEIENIVRGLISS